MSTSNDYSPIADQGELRRATGLRRRFARHAELPPVPHGFVRVIIDENGNPISGGTDGRTAGERYWAGTQTWVTVDLGDHTLELEVPLHDQTGRIGFVATTTVDVAVTDAVTVARKRIGGIKRVLEPALGAAMRDAGETAEPAGGGDAITLHTLTKRAVERALAKLVRKPIDGLPSWLDAAVTAVEVRYDDETEQHVVELRKRDQSLAIADADARTNKHKALHDRDLRALWREELSGVLSNPSMRAFESVFAEPTADNIRQAVAAVNEAERGDRQQLLESLHNLVADQNLAEFDDAQRIALESIISGLAGQRFTREAALEPASRPRELDSSDPDKKW